MLNLHIRPVSKNYAGAYYYSAARKGSKEHGDVEITTVTDRANKSRKDKCLARWSGPSRCRKPSRNPKAPSRVRSGGGVRGGGGGGKKVVLPRFKSVLTFTLYRVPSPEKLTEEARRKLPPSVERSRALRGSALSDSSGRVHYGN